MKSKKSTYDMSIKPAPDTIPAMLEVGEVVLTLKICKLLFPYLKSHKSIPLKLRDEMLKLFNK
jgi:hypothetical protein